MNDDFGILDTGKPLPPPCMNHLIAYIGNYAKVTFSPHPDSISSYSQFIIATIAPLPDALKQFEPFTSCYVLAESIAGNIENPRALIEQLNIIRKELVKLGIMPSYFINVHSQQQ